jgi:invasion protein IalB
MFRAYCAFFATALLTGMAAPALAEAPAASSSHAQPATTGTVAGDPNEVVCQKQESTGSRLARKKVCMTRAQWADRQLQDRQEIEKVQTQRGMKSE